LAVVASDLEEKAEIIKGLGFRSLRSGFVYRTRQDKTRQDKTAQDKTRQDKTRQDKTRQNKTRQDKTRKEKTRQDETRQGKTRQGKAKQGETWMRNSSDLDRFMFVKLSTVSSAWVRVCECGEIKF
jgi:hypothetical protein